MTVPGVGGCPLRYNSVEELQTAIDTYFNSCKRAKREKDGDLVVDANGDIVYEIFKPITITGLGLALGFTSRQSLLNYQGKSEFMDTITRAKFLCEDYSVNRAYDKEGFNGAKFNLTNNYGWVDKQELTLQDKRVLFEGEDKLED